jgi:hypothetical protein
MPRADASARPPPSEAQPCVSARHLARHQLTSLPNLAYIRLSPKYCRGDRRTGRSYPPKRCRAVPVLGIDTPGSGQLAFAQAATECYIFITLGYKREVLRTICPIGVR